MVVADVTYMLCEGDIEAKKEEKTETREHFLMGAKANSLLQLLLGSELGRVTALALTAVGGTRRETGVAFAADLLVTVVLAGKNLERGLDDTTTETEDKVKGGLLLDVVVREGAAVLELLTSKDETLLVGGDTLLVLDLGLDVVDGVGRLHLKGDGLTCCGWDA